MAAAERRGVEEDHARREKEEEGCGRKRGEGAAAWGGTKPAAFLRQAAVGLAVGVFGSD